MSLCLLESFFSFIIFYAVFYQLVFSQNQKSLRSLQGFTRHLRLGLGRPQHGVPGCWRGISCITERVCTWAELRKVTDTRHSPRLPGVYNMTTK